MVGLGRNQDGLNASDQIRPGRAIGDDVLKLHDQIRSSHIFSNGSLQFDFILLERLDLGPGFRHRCRFLGGHPAKEPPKGQQRPEQAQHGCHKVNRLRP